MVFTITMSRARPHGQLREQIVVGDGETEMNSVQQESVHLGEPTECYRRIAVMKITFTASSQGMRSRLASLFHSGLWAAYRLASLSR